MPPLRCFPVAPRPALVCPDYVGDCGTRYAIAGGRANLSSINYGVKSVQKVHFGPNLAMYAPSTLLSGGSAACFGPPGQCGRFVYPIRDRGSACKPVKYRLWGKMRPKYHNRV